MGLQKRARPDPATILLIVVVGGVTCTEIRLVKVSAGPRSHNPGDKLTNTFGWLGVGMQRVWEGRRGGGGVRPNMHVQQKTIETCFCERKFHICVSVTLLVV